MQNKPIYTLRDAIESNRLAKYRKPSAAQIREETNAEIDVANYLIMKTDPEIGMLIRKGRPIYYKNNPYREAACPRSLMADFGVLQCA